MSLSNPLQFVILEHATAADTHWDLLIESAPDSLLRTWRLSENPTSKDGPIVAMPIADHRRLYLDFEGEVSGNRGHVRRVDRGGAEWLDDSATCIRVRLTGNMLFGQYEITTSGEGLWVFQRVLNEESDDK